MIVWESFPIKGDHMDYTIKLNKQMLDIVMRALGELPLKESMPVFNVINEQYIEQTKEKTKEKNNA